jgi:hypothetical protein
LIVPQLSYRYCSFEKDVLELDRVDKIIDACVGIVNKPNHENLKVERAVKPKECGAVSLKCVSTGD